MKNQNHIAFQEQFLVQLKEQGKSSNTLKNYKADLQCFNHFLINKNQSLKFNTFGTLQVQEYAQYLNQKYTSSNSIRRRVQTLRIFFDFLMSKKVFLENPIRKMSVSPKVLDKPSPNIFKDVLHIYQHLKNQKEESSTLSSLIIQRNLIIFHLIYGAGLKVSDLAKISLKNILKDKKGYRVLIDHPKRDLYSVPLPDIFEEDFTPYVKILNNMKHLQKIEFSELLFNANPYRILSGGLGARGIELFFEELKQETQINITAKSLRQSCIMKWINLNIPHTTIKEWLGVSPNYSLDLYLTEWKKNLEYKAFKELDLQQHEAHNRRGV